MNEDSRLPRGAVPDAHGPTAGGFDSGEEASSIPEDAFYNPDDPIVAVEGAIPDDAIFSPDDPITRGDDGEEGVVTGMDGETDEETRSGGDLTWQIRRTSNILESLAHALRDQGMEALRIHPETEPMDAMLRSFVAGYLVGRTDIPD